MARHIALDSLGTLSRIAVGDRLSVCLELGPCSAWPFGPPVELDATVKRHGRGGGTAILLADGIEFAMDGDDYPANGGPASGVLVEIPYRGEALTQDVQRPAHRPLPRRVVSRRPRTPNVHVR